MRIGIIVGSNRPTRIAPEVAGWVLRNLEHEAQGLDFELVDLAEVSLPFLDEPEIPAQHHYTKEHTRKWAELIESFDGFVMVFPQYNWGYPAVLKNALDYLYDEWKGKPVSLVSYGGHGGFQGALALGLVTKGLDMHSMATNPQLDISREMFDNNGHFKNVDLSFEQYKPAVKAIAAEFTALRHRAHLP